jgi:hypothetical protein
VDPRIKKHIHVISFQLLKPAHLPFHLLAWGQYFIKRNNCPPPNLNENDIKSYESTGILPLTVFRDKNQDYEDLYQICMLNIFKNHVGRTFHVNYWNDSYLNEIDPPYDKNDIQPTDDIIDYTLKTRQYRDHVRKRNTSLVHPIRYVYYTENDQIIKFDSSTTFHALVTASNETTFFTGKLMVIKCY